MGKIHSAIYPVMDLFAEHLKGKGSLVLTKNLDPGKKYFSENEADLVQPGIYCSLGVSCGYNLLAGLEINWYKPGKIYMGVLATDNGFGNLSGDLDKPIDDQTRVQMLADLKLEDSAQAVMGRWIWWRYLTLQGKTTAKTQDGNIVCFKEPRGCDQLLDDPKLLGGFIEAGIVLWDDLLSRRLTGK